MCSNEEIVILMWPIFLFSLNLHAQKLLKSMGSTMIDKLTFRDVWSFVGQKGIDGHSTLEEVLISYHTLCTTTRWWLAAAGPVLLTCSYDLLHTLYNTHHLCLDAQTLTGLLSINTCVKALYLLKF